VVNAKDSANRNEMKNLEEVLLESHIVHLNANIFGIVLGLLAGLLIFIATNFLLLKGGDVVGPHLSLLGQFFIGYSVSFVGSLIGFLYGFVLGYITGFLIGWFYNKVAEFRAR